MESSDWLYYHKFDLLAQHSTPSSSSRTGGAGAARIRLWQSVTWATMHSSTLTQRGAHEAEVRGFP